MTVKKIAFYILYISNSMIKVTEKRCACWEDSRSTTWCFLGTEVHSGLEVDKLTKAAINSEFTMCFKA